MPPLLLTNDQFGNPLLIVSGYAISQSQSVHCEDVPKWKADVKSRLKTTKLELNYLARKLSNFGMNVFYDVYIFHPL